MQDTSAPEVDYLSFSLPDEAVGLKLFRIDARERLIGCEAMRFNRGRIGVELTLRRARISGRVEMNGKIENHFADVLDEKQNMIETVALDAKSYSALKNKWMRCRTEPAP